MILSFSQRSTTAWRNLQTLVSYRTPWPSLLPPAAHSRNLWNASFPYFLLYDYSRSLHSLSDSPLFFRNYSIPTSDHVTARSALTLLFGLSFLWVAATSARIPWRLIRYSAYHLINLLKALLTSKTVLGPAFTGLTMSLGMFCKPSCRLI